MNKLSVDFQAISKVIIFLLVIDFIATLKCISHLAVRCYIRYI